MMKSAALLPRLPESDDSSDASVSSPAAQTPIGLFEEIGYRFPLGRLGVEMLPSVGGSFGLRMGWHRAKTVVSVFETTALRPLAEVTRGGQTYPLFFTQHGRQKRGRIRLAGRRKTAKSPQCALRFITTVSGRDDKLVWQWRIGASKGAMAQPVQEGASEDSVTLFLPLAPGKGKQLLPPGAQPGDPLTVASVWVNDLLVSVAPYGEWSGGTIAPTMEADAKGFRLHLPSACLGGSGVLLGWETWVSPARTEADARQALLTHCAHRADQVQIPQERPGDFFTRLMQTAQAELMDDARVDKKTGDRLWLRAVKGERDRHVAGDGADAALTAHALLTRFYLTGDDALRRRARLLANGVGEFQITNEESPHWGAIRDSHVKKSFCDSLGRPSVGVQATGRASRGLHLLHAHFKTDEMHRAALHAAQWLLLKTDKDGRLAFGRYAEAGPRLGDQSENGWNIAETFAPLAETFRATKNDVYQKAALRNVKVLGEDLTRGALRFEQATTEQLGTAIEGILHVSREYERPELIALAQQIGRALRARRLPNGTFKEPADVPAPLSPLTPLLWAARGAFALQRVDDDTVWPLLALRALHAAGRLADADPTLTTIADWGGLCTLPASLLLNLAARVQNCVPDRDDLTLKRGWHTFSPDPAAAEYISVRAIVPDDEADGPPAVDFLPLVCPLTLQVMLLVLAPAHVKRVRILKNGRVPYVKNLLTGDYDQSAVLSPLGDGKEAMAGVFLADT